MVRHEQDDDWRKYGRQKQALRIFSLISFLVYKQILWLHKDGLIKESHASKALPLL